MKTKIIKITSVTDITNFVREAQKVYGDVTVKKGRYVIDGKSLMGMFSLDGSTGLTIEYPETAYAFEEFIEPFSS